MHFVIFLIACAFVLLVSHRTIVSCIHQKSKWEIVDMGSLNGTFLNSRAIHNQDSSSRQWSEPVELGDGDIITLGTSTRVSVSHGTIFHCTEFVCLLPNIC